MIEPKKPTKAPELKSSRLEEMRRIIEEYVDDLREILEKLRRKMH